MDYNAYMTETSKQPRRRRWWLRFRLRTFLIILTILCVWLGWFLYRVEQQRSSVHWIEQQGGFVYYGYESRIRFPDDFDYLSLSPSSVFVREPPVPDWLLHILDIHYFSDVVGVDLVDTQVSDLKPIAGLRNLETLQISDTQVSDVSPLAGLTNLKWLLLDGTQVSDVTPLATLKNLQWLLLSNQQVCDEEIEKLQLALPNCDIQH